MPTAPAPWRGQASPWTFPGNTCGTLSATSLTGGTGRVRTTAAYAPAPSTTSAPIRGPLPHREPATGAGGTASSGGHSGVSSNGPALLAAAAGVGFGHAILPDHWVPLAVLGRTRRYPLSRVARLSGLAGVAHVLVSIILGGAIIAIGLQFRSAIEHAEGAIV